MKKFKDEMKANEFLVNSRQKKFCPLINAYCTSECVCYYNGSVIKELDRDNIFSVYPACCKNVLISGKICIGK